MNQKSYLVLLTASGGTSHVGERAESARERAAAGPFAGLFGPGLRLARSCIANWSGMTTVESESIYRRIGSAESVVGGRICRAETERRYMLHRR